MKKPVLIGLVVLSAWALQSCGDANKAKNYNEKTTIDQDAIAFIKGGLEGGATEVRAASIAKIISKNPRVVHFAEMMITDHTNAGTQLKKLEEDKYVTSRDSVDDEHKKMLNDLSQKAGVDFDKSYMGMMVADHEKAVKLFNDASNNKALAIQNFARETLPKIQMHLDSAKAIAASLK